jgi:hypothetical protein
MRPRSGSETAGSAARQARASDRRFVWPNRFAVARMARGIISMWQTRRMTMKNPLDSIWGTIISGLVLTAILYVAVKNFLM